MFFTVNIFFKGRAVDPHSCFADPDPAAILNADPDPEGKMNADPSGSTALFEGMHFLF